MGKSRKFIKKGEGQQFYLLHRSQRDEAYSSEQVPSEFVLVSKAKSDNQQQQQQLQISSNGDHIDKYGFRNDGYDYSKHLKVIDDGEYLGKDGKFRKNQYVSLPEEALPSEIELERNFQAITISHDVMDDDIREALFGELGEEFEELDDDFVSQVIEAPEKPDFDFDGHIAKLMELSEKKTRVSKVSPRGWENDSEKLLLTNENINSLSNEDDFDNFLADYDDEMIGPVSHIDECGLSHQFSETAISDVLDESLQEQLDLQLSNGLSVEDIQKSKLKISLARSEILSSPSNPGLDNFTKLDGQEECYSPEDNENQTLRFDPSSAKELEEVLNSQEYLRQTKPKEKYDCETIISTYSTLDNHPSIIRTIKTKPTRTQTQVNTQNSKFPIESSSKLESQLTLQRTINESKADKKVRKQSTKIIQRENRILKKETKIAFKSLVASSSRSSSSLENISILKL